MCSTMQRYCIMYIPQHFLYVDMDINAIKVNEVVHMSGAPLPHHASVRRLEDAGFIHQEMVIRRSPLATAAQERIINSNLPSARRSLDHSLFCSAIVI